MQMHASCAAREGVGVLLLGASGAGKSDMVLRLQDHGFKLVADDRVEIDEGFASPAAGLAGLLEVRGLGILRLPHLARAQLRLVVELGTPTDRLPAPVRHDALGLPLLIVDPLRIAAARQVALALDCVLGRVSLLAGAFA
jgi:HPr kinase/phosphorylase